MRRFGFGRLASSLPAAFLLVALVAIPATAHAQLDKPTPADKATVTQPVTVVSGTFVERVNPNGSSLVVKLVGGSTVATGGVDPSNAKQMLATPATPLGSGSYLVQWTTVSLDDGELARGTWTFTVAVAPSAAATPAASPTPGPSATVAPTAATTVAPSAAAPSIAPTPQPSAADDTTGSGNDVVVPIIVALIVLGAGAAYLLSRRNRPTRRPDATDHPDARRHRPPRRPRRDPAACGTPGERPRGGDRPRPRPARDGRGPCPEPDLHEPAAARGLRRRRRDGGGAVVRVRHRPRRPGSATGPHLAGRRCRRPGCGSGCAPSGSSAGCGSSARGSRAGRATVRSRPSSCGTTAGSAWPSSARSSARPGTSSTRSRRSTTWRRGSWREPTSRAGPPPTTRSGSDAGRGRSGSPCSSGSSSSCRRDRRCCSWSSSGTPPTRSR